MTVPRGHMACFSVDTEEEARRLLTLACPRNLDGEFVAEELAVEQTVEALFAFGDRLATVYREHADYICAHG